MSHLPPIRPHPAWADEGARGGAPTAAVVARRPDMTPRSMSNNERTGPAVVAWLWTCVALIAAIVVVGGATRLTGSGLSITEWQPLTGTLPPMSAEAWDDFFALYQRSPQYQLENSHFGLSEFKTIFWWEWAHRLLGRVIGMALLLPLVAFWSSGRLPDWLKRRGMVAVLLVGFQGALGWFMVASGLVDEPRVSHLRLAAHLMTALATCGYVMWTALDAQQHAPSTPGNGRRAREVGIYVVVLAVQILWGAFVAGLDAGFAYPTWPRMGTAYVPPDFVGDMGLLASLVDHPIAVQWVHRWLGAALVVVGLTVVTRAMAVPALRNAATIVAVALVGQFALGVVTVLRFYMEPVPYGVAHQAGGLLLVLVSVAFWHAAARADRERDSMRD